MLFKVRITSVRVGSAVLFASFVACTGDTIEAPRPGLDFDFSDGVQGWAAQFADYPPGDDAFYELASRGKRLRQSWRQYCGTHALPRSGELAANEHR
jgi:hypothetical protein